MRNAQIRRWSFISVAMAILTMLLLLTMTSCGAGRTRGVVDISTRLYAPAETVWNAAKETFSELKVTVKREKFDGDKGNLLGGTEQHARVEVIINSLDDGSTFLSADASKSSSSSQDYDSDFAEQIVRMIRSKL